MADITDLARKIAAARKSRSFLEFSGSTACASSAQAYAVQAQVAGLVDEQVAGWKVGLGPDGIAMAAPILTGDLVANGGSFALSGDLASLKVEAELALRLGRDIPVPASGVYDAAGILDAVSAVFCGIELVATRFINDADVDFPSRLADNFAHAAYVAGSGTAGFSGIDLSQVPCTVTRDGQLISDRKGGHPLGDPLIPVLAWAALQCDALGGLRAGQFITTGTLIDPFPVAGRTQVTAVLAGIGSASVAINSDK